MKTITKKPYITPAVQIVMMQHSGCIMDTGSNSLNASGPTGESGEEFDVGW